MKIFVTFLIILSLSFGASHAEENAFSCPAFTPKQNKAAKISVYKSKRILELLDDSGDVMQSYKIALGGQPQGHKTTEGDEKTPEGQYCIQSKNPKSAYHLSLKISYPNVTDLAQAKKRNVSAGGDIMIHGEPNALWGVLHSFYPDTWTDGCVAVNNQEIEVIYHKVDIGTPIEILP